MRYNLTVSQKQLFGPYRLEELIGRGGMGEVYRAYDTRRDRIVALKILPSSMADAPEFSARFRREAQLVARLSAPHIIPIHDFGEIDGRLFLDMRLVSGVDLATVLEAGPLPPPRAIEMISQVASALDAAHTDGLVHRDVKPSNMLYVGDPRGRIPEHDQPDFVYLVDFGIARSLDTTEGSALTATGHAVGTLGYMAPERFSGEPADRRVDVYALACTLYEALAGRPPFAGDGLAALMYAHLQRMPTPISVVNRAVPAALDNVLATGMAKRARRPLRHGRGVRRGRPFRAARRARRASGPSDPDPPPRGDHRPPAAVPGGPLPRTVPARTVPAGSARSDRATALARHPRPAGTQIAGAAVAAVALLAGAVVGVRALQDDGVIPGPLAACGSEPLTCNGAGAQQLVSGGEVAMAIDADIENWNVDSPLGSVGAAPWVMSSVLPHTFDVGPDFSTTRNTDLLSGAERPDPRTVVYTINPDAAWNDGTPVSAEDFVYNWRTRNGRDCPDCPTYATGYETITAITGGRTADGTLTVTLSFTTPYPEWQTLFGVSSPLYPAHIAARHGDLNAPAGLRAAFDWFVGATPDYSAGPLTVQARQPGSPIVLVRNPGWYGRPTQLDRVVLQIATDSADQVSLLREGRVQVISPTAAPGLAGQLGDIAGVAAYQGASMGWERIDLNLRTPALQDPALRQALFAAVDLDQVREIGTAGFGAVSPMGSHNFVPGQPGFTDVLADTGQGAGDLQAARRILTAAGYSGIGSQLVAPDGTRVPPLRAVYTRYLPARERVASYVSEMARELGVTITPTATDSLSGTLGDGDFDLMLYGWSNPPTLVANAQQSWGTGGESNYGRYSNPEVDRLLAAASGSEDAGAAYELLNQADRVLTRDAVVLPLYRRPSLLAVRENVANVRDNPVLGPFYNVAQWGVRSG